MLTTWCINTYERGVGLWFSASNDHASLSYTPARTCINSVLCWNQLTQQELIIKYLGILQFLILKLLVA